MDKNHKINIQKASEFFKNALNETKGSIYDPLFHSYPLVNWLNDPNGLIFFKGEYHIFYQCNPYSPSWGKIHWGHMKSKDLIRWEHLPLALAPCNEYDSGGCFSGSAIEKDGTMFLVYTGNKYIDPSKDGSIYDEMIQTQCIAKSEDGINFSKVTSNPVIEYPPKGGERRDFRDPKIYYKDGKYYIVVAAKVDNDGKILLYESVDLDSWTYRGAIFESKSEFGIMLECPDLFSLNQTDILLISSINKKDEGSVSGYLTGSLDYEENKFNTINWSRLDYGNEFYAPQSFKDEKERRILFGFYNMSKAITPSIPWRNALTLPREINLKENNKITTYPVEEIKGLRSEILNLENIIIDKKYVFSSETNIMNILSEKSFEIEVEFDLTNSTSSEFQIDICASSDYTESTKIIYNKEKSSLNLNKKDSSITFNNKIEHIENEAPVPYKGIQKLNIFMDKSIIEIFINEGESVISSFIFPKEDSNNFSISVKSGFLDIRKINFYKLEL